MVMNRYNTNNKYKNQTATYFNIGYPTYATHILQTTNIYNNICCFGA